MSESAAANAEDMCRYTLSMFLGYIYAFTHRAGKIYGGNRIVGNKAVAA